VIAESTDSLLGILKWALLALLYLFFARVLWAVWSEVRQRPEHATAGRTVTPVAPEPAPHAPAPAAAHRTASPMDPTMPSPVPIAPSPAPVAAAAPVTPASESTKRIPKGRRGKVGRLVVTQPRQRKGTAFATVDELTLGRASTCHVSLADDTYASQLHARVFRRDGAMWVEDLGSTNGTFVNGRRISSATQLSVGDRLQVGNTILEAQ
jgi:pSer/pThr/pTyr-binding forkhead associated (FHA) protein